MTEIIEVNGASMLEAINRSEVDMQIVTAHKFPRDIEECKKNIEALATMDDAIAYNCFYHLERTDKNGQKAVIEGPSVRLAEIISTCWKNLRVAARIIGNDGKTITAQGVCHDLETNVAISVEVKRSILTSKGNTYSQDMQVVVGNAAASIALRNAICKVVPQVLIKSVVQNIQSRALEHIKKIGVEESWKSWVAYMQVNFHVTEGMMLDYLGKKREELTVDDVQKIVGVYNAINEGSTTVEESFKKPKEQSQQAKDAKKVAEGVQQKAQQAMSRATSRNKQ